MIEYVGLFFELIFLTLGVLLYLFAIGKYRPAGEAARRTAEAYRQKNHWWLRLGSLLLIAMMAVNIYLHVRDLLAGA